ncbi:MAG: DUF4041 domain-containing protein [Planctomycetota bacterium]
MTPEALHPAQIQEPPPQPSSVSSTDAERKVALLEAEIDALRSRLSGADTGVEVAVLNDEQVLQSVGIYRYHHPLENAAAYRERLTALGEQIAELVKLGDAISCSNLFTYDNSLAKGKKMTKDLGRLMLRAYNAEVENSLRSMRAGNIDTAKKRVETARRTISQLGSLMEMHISDAFHSLRIQELELTSDFLMRKQEEREQAREERARMREEKRAAAELAEERERLDKERAHIETALAALRSTGQTSQELEDRLAAIDSAIQQNDFRAASIRAGYAHVISNQGAFGKGVVKIGLTRRLTPN